MQESDNSQDSGAMEPISKVVSNAVIALARISRNHLGRQASLAKTQLEKRQLKTDRQVMWSKLGREVCALVDAGEVVHPGLVRGVERIRSLEAKMAMGSLEDDSEAK